MKHAPRGPRLKPTAEGKLRKWEADHGNPLHVGDPLHVPKRMLRGNPTPCSGHCKRTPGKPCPNPAIKGGTVCRMHGGSAPQVKASAKERLMALQPKAIQTLNALLDASGFPTVQLGAAKDVLDRTEGKAKENLSLSGADGGPLEISLVTRLQAARRRTDGGE